VVSASAGTVYGFAVASAVPFRFLRDGDGVPLDVVPDDRPPPEGEPIQQWREPGTDEPFARLFGGPGGTFRLWIAGIGWYSSEPAAPRIGIPPTGIPSRVEERAWGLPAMLCFRQRGGVPLHAAAVEIGGRAVLLTGASGAGKTTLAAACHRAGHRLLAEDLACVVFDGALGPFPAGAGAAVVPGPALVRLRPDVAALLGPLDGEVVEGPPDRVRVALAPERRGDCRPVPLAAVVFLADGDDLDVAPADPVRAVQDLWVASFRFPTAAERARSFDEVVRLADAVPGFALRRPLRPDTLDAAVDAVASIARGQA
jgi:hypothetical protein